MADMKCSRCGNPSTQPDQYPEVFAYYCPKCGHRDRIDKSEEAAAGATAPSVADPQSAEWRRAHGFPD